mmetsp:Transcript_20186/g.31560  ORF Transcript_20186/g.31560 Transcript_20186/m.31560 type:complete len:184 (-) Transcript_20186:176-727(-)
MSKKEFAWPTHYDFPPFFTKQPNRETNTKRVQMWKELIMAYCQSNRIFVINIRESLPTSPLFGNEKISRRLRQDDLHEIIQYMVAAGLAEWLPGETNKVMIYWRKPSEWADIMFEWVQAQGLNESVMTLYEIREGDATVGSEFHGMDSELLLKTLKVMEKMGRAVLFDAEGGDASGVKFLAGE